VNCTVGSEDVLKAGDAVVINNVVLLPRNPSQIFYDGGDMILSSDPIAVVRGGFANSTGPLLAGAVEVYDTASWGKEFVAPVGEDTVNLTLRLDPFRTTSLYIMAGTDNTTIDYENSTSQGQVTINKGDTFVVNGVNQGNTINSTKDIQIHILTGENGFPWYELRWYSLLSTDMWSNDYISPVGLSDGAKKTRVWIFNPGSSDLTVAVQILKLVNDTLTPTTNPVKVPAGTAVRTPFDIPSNSSARVFAGNRNGGNGYDGPNFFAFTQTDIEDPSNQDNSGQREDWGHPLIAVKDLTAQAIVGVGWQVVWVLDTYPLIIRQ
jgi:hypothetical protein